MIGRSIESHALSTYYCNCGEKKGADPSTHSVRTGFQSSGLRFIWSFFFPDRTSRVARTFAEYGAANVQVRSRFDTSIRGETIRIISPIKRDMKNR